MYILCVCAFIQGAVNASEPECLNGTCDYDAMNEVLMANSSLIKDLLECFLSNPNCSIFQNVLVRQLAVDNLYQSMSVNLSMHVTYVGPRLVSSLHYSTIIHTQAMTNKYMFCTCTCIQCINIV